jgi:flagellar L-ring protein FlgH
MRLFRPLILPLSLALLGGCSTVSDFLYPRVQMDQPATPAQPQAALAMAPAATGSIFNSATYRPLFEDHRARLVGDTLTVQIVERVSASASSTSTVDKTGKLEGSVGAFPGVRRLSNASLDASSKNAFEGKGTTESSNDFAGTITVVVTQVMANGHLVVTGEKQIGVNNNVDVLRFSGSLDPRAIQPGNVVDSTSIANVRVEHRGRGAKADAQVVGWLARVFLSLLPF